MLTACWQILLQLAPWILLGTAIAGLLHVLLPKGFIHRRLRGVSGVIEAVAIGVPLPLCSCGVIPAGLGLKKDGASDGAAVAFLISTPQTGVDSILVSASFLGWPFALFKVLAAAITGLAGGWIVDRIGGERDDLVSAPGRNGDGEREAWWQALWNHSVDILRSIWRWLVFGVVVSAAISVLMPPGGLAGLGALGIVPSSLVVLAISLPLYVCATASVPIAAALVANGLPPGAALVFLMAGPATNVATIGAVYRHFGIRVLAVYLSTIILGSCLAAIAFEWLIPAPAAVAAATGHDHHAAWWSIASAVALLILFAWFGLTDLRRWLRKQTAGQASPPAEFRTPIRGMTCMNCVHRLEQALRGVEGSASVIVTLEPGEAIVRGNVVPERVRDAIRQAGFQVD